MTDRTTFVEAALDNYTTIDPADRVLRDLVRAFVRADPEAVGRSDGYAHVTGSGYVIARDSGSALLHFHRRLARWLPFGGHAEPNELDPASTAIRESSEESGFADLGFSAIGGSSPLDVDVHVIPSSERGPAHIHLDFRYAVFTESERAPDPALGESRLFRWLRPGEVPDGVEPSVLRCLEKIWRSTLPS